MNNITAIVGRPNVGKSTLFNRLTGTREAIVHETSGVTRDRHYGRSDWNGIEFSVIDTGGYVENSDDIFEEEIRKQVNLAIEESDVIIFLVDVLTGITALDEAMTKMLYKIKKKAFLVVNKVDNSKRIYDSYVFHSLGFDKIYCISSINGTGTGELLDAIVKEFTGKKEIPVADIPKLAIIGRPNVGKSSLINVLLGEERNIVTPVPGTTRDAIYTRFKKFGYDFFLIDTAGLRKKAKVTENIEFYSVMRSIRAIEHSDVCLLLVDATQGFEMQDMNIFHIVEKNKKGIVIVMNKWDLITKETNTTKIFEKEIRKKLEPFDDVPVIFTSALTKQRIHKVLETAIQVEQNRRQRIPTSGLNKIMLDAVEAVKPPAIKGKNIQIKYITQLPAPTPSFAFFCNLPQYIKEPYKRYLENQLRSHFNFTGVPIQIFFRKK
ncbi:MAG: ribosome biogenesis GTPase Der [Bacteroidia bacterium]|nr:ribosome biogenesis GTPase Der [Bacteroidia bacterium]